MLKTCMFVSVKRLRWDISVFSHFQMDTMHARVRHMSLDNQSFTNSGFLRKNKVTMLYQNQNQLTQTTVQSLRH